MKDIRKVCQMMEKFDGHGGMYGVWADVITFSRCDTPQGGVKEVRNVFGWRGLMVMGGCTGCGQM